MTGGVESTAITGNTLLAFNRRMQVLWSYEFQNALRKFSPEELTWRLGVIDLEGNGESGVLFAARFQNTAIAEALFYFSSRGTMLWQLDVEPPLRNRDNRPFERAWAIKHLIDTPSRKLGRSIWVALGNDAGWAGCVLRIDAQGHANIHFANAGYVEHLCAVTTKDGNWLIICGENNDFDDAFVALIGMESPSGCSVPGERLVYRYSNAPPGSPLKYLLFPNTELAKAGLKPYGHARVISEHLDGIIVDVETGGDGASFRYHFSKDLEPSYVFPSGSHEFVHKQLEGAGTIHHTWPDCPELQSPLILRVWEPDSGWYERPIEWRDNPWKEIEKPN